MPRVTLLITGIVNRCTSTFSSNEANGQSKKKEVTKQRKEKKSEHSVNVYLFIIVIERSRISVEKAHQSGLACQPP